MKTLIVDDEAWALKQLQEELNNKNGIEIIGSFMNPLEALSFARSNTIDFALLDVKMQGINGIELGQNLRKLYPDVIIVYVSSYPEYFSDAYRNVRADYYMLKPYQKEDVNDLLQRVELLSKRQKKLVQIRTFGRFDVFINEQPVAFKNAKAKELLAICVDRKGGVVKMEEAIDKLWEDCVVDDNIKARYRKAVAYLNALFLEYRITNVFVSGYGSCHIVKENVNCDYFEYLDAKDKTGFFGEYMFEYSWAEETNARLEMQMNNNRLKI